MKWILLITIKFYWFIIPESKRRKCIFRKSCSNYVYEETIHHGLIKGIIAFRFRYQNCRHGFEIFKNPLNNQMQMILPNQQMIEEKEIAERLIDIPIWDSNTTKG